MQNRYRIVISLLKNVIFVVRLHEFYVTTNINIDYDTITDEGCSCTLLEKLLNKYSKSDIHYWVDNKLKIINISLEIETLNSELYGLYRINSVEVFNLLEYDLRNALEKTL